MVLELSRLHRSADLAEAGAANQQGSTESSDSGEDQTRNRKWPHQKPSQHPLWFNMQTDQRMRQPQSMAPSSCTRTGRQQGEQHEQKADRERQHQKEQQKLQQQIRQNHQNSRNTNKITNKNTNNNSKSTNKITNRNTHKKFNNNTNTSNKNQLCQNDVAALPSEDDNLTSGGRSRTGCDKATLRSPRIHCKPAEATQHVHMEASNVTATPKASGSAGDERKPPTAPSHHQRTSTPPRSFWLIIFVTTVCCCSLLASNATIKEQLAQTTPTLAVATSMATLLASSSLSALVALTQISLTQRRRGSLTVATATAIGGCHIGYPWPRLVTLADAAAVVTTYEPALHTEFKFRIVDEDDGGREEDDMEEEPAGRTLSASNELDGEIVVVEEDVGGGEEGDYGRFRQEDPQRRVFYDEPVEGAGGPPAAAGDEERRLRYRLQEIPLPPLNVYEVNVDFDEIEPTEGVVSTLKPHHSDDVADDETQLKKKSVTKRSSSSSGDPAGGGTSRLTGMNDRRDGATTTPLPSSTMMTPTVKASTSPTTTSPTQTSGGNNNSMAPASEECEPKVLSQIPEEPYYDYTELIGTAARQFTEYLAAQFPAGAATNLTEQMRDDVRRKANALSTVALNEDSNLLAFAIAAPSIHTVVVKFRDNVTIPLEQVHNKGYLGSYWRELGFAWNSTENSQEWGAPFRDCNLLKGRWLWPFRLSFTDANIKIVAAAFIAADEDVCNDELEEIFGRRHGCDRNTTFCLLTGEGKPLSRDAYTCICRETFYLPNSTLQGFAGELVEDSEGYNNYSCLPCPGGCTHCDQHGVCLLGEPQEAVSLENLLKVTVGSVLGACILCCVVLSVIVFRQRKSKAIASGMWTVLETILLGIVLLYASVAVHFFPASTERCLIEPWLRELGFVTCYGAIILKLYRHLVDFRTRKAHRWVLRDVDLLKYLATMIFAVICYMCAFTASSLDLMETGQLESLRELRTNTCLPMKWEYVTQASELLILCFGLHLSFASRNANTQFRERQFLVVTLVLEFVVSATFYLMRWLYLPEMSPGATFLALFVRSLLTNTIALGLIFVPKLWYQHKQGSHDAGQRLGGGYAGLCLGDPDIGELTISEMSPEDIRAELKRLYTQLEILKNKTLRQDNPHISKRRGGRKAGHRRFSLQKKGSKDKALSAKHRSNKHHQDIEITEAEPSRTPEDSVCSAEGPTDTYAEISGVSHSMISHSVVSHSVASHSK